MVYSMVDATFGLGFTLGPVLGSVLYVYGGFLTPFLVTGVMLAVGAVQCRQERELSFVATGFRVALPVDLQRTDGLRGDADHGHAAPRHAPHPPQLRGRGGAGLRVLGLADGGLRDLAAGDAPGDLLPVRGLHRPLLLHHVHLLLSRHLRQRILRGQDSLPR